MELKVFSVYDKVSKQSVFITMHHTIEEAQREFKNVISQDAISSKAPDLELYCIGEFNTTTLELSGFDSLLIEV